VSDTAITGQSTHEVVSKYYVSLSPMDAGRLNKYGHYGVTVYTAAVYVTRTLVRSTGLVASVCRTAYVGRTQCRIGDRSRLTNNQWLVVDRSNG